MNNNIETFKLQHVALEFKVNEVKQTVTAIEKFIVPKFMLRFTTNNYSIKNLIGYEDENLQIINQTLEYINHEN